MKLNELRIGNFVFSQETQEIQRADGVDSEYVYLDCITFDYTTIDETEPIPITEDILLKCGFKKIGQNSYCIKLYAFSLILSRSIINWYPTITQELFSEKEQFVKLLSIDYIHELQNLYFALTQTDLEFKRLKNEFKKP